VSDKLGEITILSLDEGSSRFFSDISSISCEPVEGAEGHYSNCSNKDLIQFKLKEQGFDEVVESFGLAMGLVGGIFILLIGCWWYY
jgi:hypothetical protein